MRYVPRTPGTNVRGTLLTSYFLTRYKRSEVRGRVEYPGGSYLPEVEYNNNNNTFTWCGPSGGLGCTGQRPRGPTAGGACQIPIRSDGCHAVPFNLLNRV
jgi:hypothetical protein